MPVDRAVLFIDGNNWYHALRAVGVNDRMRLDYAKISTRLIGPREWLGTRYYIGRETHNATFAANQQQFETRQVRIDRRITFHYGRIEKRPTENPLANDVLRYLAELKTRIDPGVYKDLVVMAQSCLKIPSFHEKAVDVKLAVDMVTMAARNEYDAAYLLSADGDFTPAVEFVRSLNKKIYIASPTNGAQLAAVATSFITVQPGWLLACYL